MIDVRDAQGFRQPSGLKGVSLESRADRWWRSSARAVPENRPSCAASTCETPDSGTVRIDGMQLAFARRARRPTRKALAAFRREVGMVFQHFNLFPHMSVIQNVMEGPRSVLGTPRREAEGLRPRCSTRSASPRRPRIIRRGFPAASASRSRSRVRWR